MRQRILSIQALRFVFIMLVVMSHIIGKPFDFGGECGVSFFFILSGFILSYAYGGQLNDGTFHHRRFLERQLAKFYPLHVLTFVVMVLLDARLGRYYEWPKLVTNLLLLQSWVPSDSFYFVANGLSWFLSDVLFFYAVFPLLFRLLTRLTWRTLMAGTVVVLAWYAILMLSISDSLVNPLLYAAPWTRVLDFAIGILVYRLYVSSTGRALSAGLSRWSPPAVTVVELLLVGAVVASFFAYEQFAPRFRCTAMFWLVLPAVLYGFVVLGSGRGYVTRLLHHGSMQWLGSISLEIYLVHFIIIRVFYSVITPLGVGEAGRLAPNVVIAALAIVVGGAYLTKRFFVDPTYSVLVKRMK